MSRHGNKMRCKTISVDHKPENPSEKRRIQGAGGEVVFNGCYRVQHENVSIVTIVVRHGAVGVGYSRHADGKAVYTCRYFPTPENDC